MSVNKNHKMINIINKEKSEFQKGSVMEMVSA